MTDERVTVREIGEFGLIDRLQSALPSEVVAGPGVRIGIGDDAAVWAPTAGESLVITTDSLVEAIHFRLDWTDWYRLGRKTLAVNLSDIAAMGAAPKLAVVTLGLTGDEYVADLVEMYRGMGSLASRFGVAIVGGDIVRSPGCRAFHVTALGESRNGRVLTRDGARPGDLIAVSGALGASAAGLEILLAGGESPLARAATADLLVEAHLDPAPRIELGEVLLTGGATAAMDLSDGLFGDLQKICRASGVTAVVDRDDLPVAAAVRALFPDRWFDLATRGGEDYELLFTVPPGAWDALVASAAAVGSTVTRIGQIVAAAEDEPVLRVRDAAGRLEPVASGAFDHFPRS